jgi:nucleoside-diphosphate-sugar epimerase
VILEDKVEAKVLLTGASGFVGGRLRDALLDAGADVVAIRRKSSPEPDRGRSVVADYADVDGLTEVLSEEKPDYVFHVAGVVKGISYEDFQRGNVMPTRNLLAACEAGHPDVSRFMLVSSLAAFGPSAPGRPHREEDNPNPIEHYGKSKLEAEQVLERESDAVKWSIVRPSGVYGPGDAEYFEIFKLAHRRQNVFYGNQNKWFSAVYVDDCVRAMVACATSDATVGKAYFLCDGKPLTWKEFQDMVVDESGKKAITIHLPEFLTHVAAFAGELATKIDNKPRLFNRQKAKMGAQDAWTCEHRAAREDFGYGPQVPIREGVTRTFDWYRKNGWL